MELEDDLLMARMDARLIVQVIINLINNAVKYTQKGSNITLSGRREENMAVISVADDGPGISDEAKEHLFDHVLYRRTWQGRQPPGSWDWDSISADSIVNAHGGKHHRFG